MNGRGRRSDRRGDIRFSTIVTMVAMFTGLYCAYLVIPPYWESLEMKEALSMALFGWKDKNQQRGEEIFEREVNKRDLNPDLLYACTWYELRMQKQLFIECSWEVELYAPWGDRVHTLEFYVHRGIDVNGEVFDVEGYYE